MNLKKPGFPNLFLFFPEIEEIEKPLIPIYFNMDLVIFQIKRSFPEYRKEDLSDMISKNTYDKIIAHCYKYFHCDNPPSPPLSISENNYFTK